MGVLIFSIGAVVFTSIMMSFDGDETMDEAPTSYIDFF